ncbi:MAG TPA: HD-GYP domain-containing protein [Nitrospiraceae bacterium]|nr:HD-GYP domain-containing protein [Nitrospiraceae bacterium]
MKTKIPVNKLSVGMLITGLDKPWYATPFVSHRMRMTTQADVDMVKACGVQVVEVEVEEAEHHTVAAKSAGDKEPAASSVATPHSEAPSNAPGAVQPGKAGVKECYWNGTASPPGSGRTMAAAGSVVVSGKSGAAAVSDPDPGEKTSALAGEPTEFPPTPFEQELAVAKAGYHQTKQIVQQAMAEAKMGRAFNSEAVVTAVDSLVGSVLRNPDALTSLARLKSFDEYTYYHSVNTCVLGLAVGRNLRMNRDDLQRIAFGTLLHDIGKMQLSAELLNRPGRLEGDDLALVKRHVEQGAEYLSRLVKVEPPVLLPVLEHHERLDGSGYPFGKKRHQLSEFGMIAAVVDVYDALTSDRPYRKAVTPHHALQMLYDMTRRGLLDAAFVERLIRCIGIYPVGSCVQLNTGEVAIVSRMNQSQTLNPVVVVIRESTAGPNVPPKTLDLSMQATKPIKRITEVLDAGRLGVVPNAVLEAVAA